ncbi:MAG TPA: hypothetical protein VFN05_16090 [Actinomycetes bacterium]|nr:hypothetical protein [Actinomycetes bacterium]
MPGVAAGLDAPLERTGVQVQPEPGEGGQGLAPRVAHLGERLVGGLNVALGKRWVAAQHEFDKGQDEPGSPGARPVAKALEQLHALHGLLLGQR